MQLTPGQFKVLILVIGLVVGIAISFLSYSVTGNLISFIFLPICVGLVYFQMIHPIGRK